MELSLSLSLSLSLTRDHHKQILTLSRANCKLINSMYLLFFLFFTFTQSGAEGVSEPEPEEDLDEMRTRLEALRN